MKKPTADELLAIIRKHCLDCSGGSRREVKKCLIQDCTLYPFRMNVQENSTKTVKRKEGQLSIFDLYKTNAS